MAIDAGADVVLGSGPHVLRGLELYKGRLIAYSLGNLAGWHNFGTGGRSSLSALITVALAPDGRFFVARIASYRLDGAGVPHADPKRGACKLMNVALARRLPAQRAEDRPPTDSSARSERSSQWPPPTSR